MGEKEEEMIKACENGDLKEIKNLLDSGVDINTRNDRCETPLIIAAKYGHKNVVDHLLTVEGVDLNAHDEFGYYRDGDSALTIACTGGHSEIVKSLLETCLIDVNYVKYDNGTALILAIQKLESDEHLECIKLLLNHRVDLGIPEGMEYSPLFYAIQYSSNDKRSAECIKLLIQHGADVNTLMRDQQRHALEFVITLLTGDPLIETVRLFLKHGTDATVGKTALKQVIEKVPQDGGKLECVRLLLEYGTDVNIQDDRGHSALMFAVKSISSVECVKLLLQHGADINAKDSDGDSILTLTIENMTSDEDVECMKMCLEHGADVNSQNDDGDTALMYAIQNLESERHLECINLLLQKGADVNIKNESGETALTLAKANDYNRQKKCIKMLEKHFARGETETSEDENSGKNTNEMVLKAMSEIKQTLNDVVTRLNNQEDTLKKVVQNLKDQELSRDKAE